jgi:hypothetical protein
MAATLVPPEFQNADKLTPELIATIRQTWEAWAQQNRIFGSREAAFEKFRKIVEPRFRLVNPLRVSTLLCLWRIILNVVEIRV